MRYRILLLASSGSALRDALSEDFDVHECTPEALEHTESPEGEAAPWRVVVVALEPGGLDLQACGELLERRALRGIPLLAVAQDYSLAHKLKACEMGCDDMLDARAPVGDLIARITQSVFNAIASEQLSQRLQTAVHRENPDDAEGLADFWQSALGADNLDQLGQVFFRELEGTRLSCSLQMRSDGGVKNMEAHGMAKRLESQLLAQLSGAGAVLEVGRRCVLNGRRCSVLLRNTPPEPGPAQAAKNYLRRLLATVDHCVERFDERARARAEADARRDLIAALHAALCEAVPGEARPEALLARAEAALRPASTAAAEGGGTVVELFPPR